MTTHRPKRPRDPAQLAKMIVDIATGEVKDPVEEVPAVKPEEPKGRPGGLKGGPARASSLDPDARRRIAAKAASTRWQKGSAAPGKKEPV